MTLSKVHQTAKNDVASSTDKPYYWKDNLLYRQWRPHGDAADVIVNQVVLHSSVKRRYCLWLMVFPKQDTWAKRRQGRESCNIFTGLPYIKILSISADVASSVRSHLIKESLKLP